VKKQKIVIITSRFPYPLDKGDKLRIYYQIKYLSKRHEIYLISLNTEKKINLKSISAIQKYCVEIHIIQIGFVTKLLNLIKAFLVQKPLQVGYFYSKVAHKKIKKIISKINPDWCYSQLIRTSEYTRHEENNIIDYMDALSKGIDRRISTFPKIIQNIIKREYQITQKYENDIFSDFKKHIIITANDRNHINHPEKKNIYIVENGVDTNYFKPLNKKKDYDLIFVGNMSYPPNIQAALYICNKIAPIIEKKYKKCKILIGGTNPHKKIQKLHGDNITISGWTKDIREIYASGKVFVAPMFIGTGLQNKLLEAMAMGVPCVTTKLANQALLANPSQITIANNEIEFANACIQILKNNQKSNMFKREAFKFIREKYSWEIMDNKLNAIFE